MPDSYRFRGNMMVDICYKAKNLNIPNIGKSKSSYNISQNWRKSLDYMINSWTR